MIDRLIEVRRRCGIERNVERTKEMRISKQLSPVKIMIAKKTGSVPVAARSKAWVCGRSPAEIVGSNLTGGMDVCLL